MEDLPSDTTGMSQEQIKQQRYKDMLSGNIDTVNRGNRYFGQAKADPNQELWLGEVKKKEPFAPTADKRGIQIFDSILNELQDIQKQELFDLVKVYSLLAFMGLHPFSLIKFCNKKIYKIVRCFQLLSANEISPSVFC